MPPSNAPNIAQFTPAADLFILSALTLAVNQIANTARQNASWIQAMADSIRVGTATKTGNDYRCDITSGGASAPMAVAYEFGSGIHRTRGAAGLYPIRARNVPELHFWWENRHKWFIGYELPFGHPGVAPRPFMQPAIDQHINDLTNRIATAFLTAYRQIMPSVINIVPQVTVIHGQER